MFQAVDTPMLFLAVVLVQLLVPFIPAAAGAYPATYVVAKLPQQGKVNLFIF